MENKSLGRGFREISNVFISTDRKAGVSLKKPKEDIGNSGFDRSDKPSEDSECPAFVNQPDACCNDTTATDSGHQEPTLSDIMKTSGELSDLAENMREVEENITVEKNISYPNTPDSQQNIIKALCEHLEGGFRIQTIELVKTETKCRPGKKKSKTEKITIFLEEPPALAEI